MKRYIPIPIVRSIGSNHSRNEFPIGLENVLIISHISNQEIPLVSLSLSIKRILTMAMVTSLIIGSYYKYIMYSYVWTTNRKHCGWMHRPINILIVSSAAVHHFTHLWMGLSYAMILTMETSMADAKGDHVCEITSIIGTYGLIYLSVGSLGISLYRVIYIKREHWIKQVVGEKRLLGIVLTFSLMFCGIMVGLFNLETIKERAFVNMCYGLSTSDVQIMIEHDLSRGRQILTTTTLRKIILIVCIGIQAIELGIYIWFFYTRYKKDNGKIKQLLTQENIKDRNMKNITTFVGQFYGFMVEYSFLFITLICTHLGNDDYNHLQAFVTFIKFLDFGLLSAVEVYSSPALRRFMK